MGKRPKLHTRSMISVPVPVDLGRRILRAAELQGKKLAPFCRDAIVEKVEAVLAAADPNAGV